MPDIQIKVILCPNQDFQGEDPPLDSWPGARGVTVRLTKKPKAARNGPHTSDATDSDGLIGLRSVAEGSYSVAVPDVPEFWKCVKRDVTVTAEEGQVHTVLLVPEKGHQLVLWDLSYDDPATGSGSLRDVRIEVAAGAGFRHEFRSGDDGRVDAVAPLGNVTVTFEDAGPEGRKLLPPKEKLTVPVSTAKNPQPRPVKYAPEIRLSVKPVAEPLSGGEQPLEGAVVTLQFNGRSLQQTLEKDKTQVSFPRLAPGIYGITVAPPAEGMALVEAPPDISLQPGDIALVTVSFKEKQKIRGRVETEDGKLVTQDVRLRISGAGGRVECTATGGTFETFVAPDGPLTIGVVSGQKLGIADIPLAPSADERRVLSPAQETVVTLEYEHAIKGRAIDEQGRLVPDAKIDIYDAAQGQIATIQADRNGRYIYGVAAAGKYFVAQHPEQDTAIVREPVEVHSTGYRDVRILAALERASGEAMTDLSAYPVLTEEVATTGGFPAPSGAGPGSDYGQTVDQVMRDVLGWRPSTDVSGFQAALAGTFQLREVEGHTEWTWQQRGYSVQADMGALTGAQASIYARAKSALDQIQPLVAGLTPLNPALFTPEEREAIRTVVATELAELVSELSFTGGPRIQRVDELFTLLTGESIARVRQNPDHVRGHLGTLRQRFALTVDQVSTVDDERMLTNFRITVEQVLALQTSWHSDRGLLSGVGAQTSLGTLLIWLSRGLDAVVESVEEVDFTLDSVFIDAAQRQVVELRLAGMTVDVPDLPLKNGAASPYSFDPQEPPLLLSDLLDWVTRASRDEGPRLIQDAGKDGVLAFAPVLDRLRHLVHGVRKLARHSITMPAGMRTPRVHRALDVLAGQLDQAAYLAELVQEAAAPQISEAWWADNLQDAQSPFPAQIPLTKPSTGKTGPLWVVIRGSNFRGPATVVLTPSGRADLPVLFAPCTVQGPSFAYAGVASHGSVLNSPGATWRVSLINSDATQSDEIDVLPV